MSEKGKANIVMGFGLFAVLALAYGCAQPPTQQYEATQTAMENARSSGATEYAKEELAKLEEGFKQAKEELSRQEKRTWAVFRSYTKADELLKQVSQDATQVAATAAERKEQRKTAAEGLEKEARLVVASAEALLTKAPVGKDRAAVKAIKTDVNMLGHGLDSVHQLIEKGDYAGAEAQAKAVKDKGAAISGELQKAIDKAKGARRHVS